MTLFVLSFICYKKNAVLLNEKQKCPLRNKLVFCPSMDLIQGSSLHFA